MSTPLDLPAFARLHALRAPRIAWFFGAGASAAAGVATASQMTWDFKARIYATAKGLSLAGLDFADPAVRKRIQSHFDAQPGSPGEGSEDEYSFYFEHAYPAAADRRAYLDAAINLGRPTYGHLGLAALMGIGKVGVIWTTNFDRVVEDAAAALHGTTRTLTVATIDSPDLATSALRDGRLPLYVKLHGDYQSEHLKNIKPELRTQDVTLRVALGDAAARFGLAVVGYSGRDQSVMEALNEGLNASSPYPSGLYWFAHGSNDPAPQVTAFLDAARIRGVDAHLLRFETFDELFATLMTLETLPPNVEAALQAARPPSRLRPFPIPLTTVGQRFPVIRMNALLVEQAPATARRIACDVGGTGEVRTAIESAAAQGIGHRRRDGVIAFGLDADLRRAFSPHRITAFDIAPLDAIGGPPSDRGLLYDALLAALSRAGTLQTRSHGRLLAVVPSRSADPLFASLRTAVGELTGKIPSIGLAWSEAVEVQLEARLGRLWLVFTPTISVATHADERERVARGVFIKERLAARYNPKSNALLDAWSKILGGGTRISSFGLTPGAGLDAEFTISNVTAFARPGR